ncbi:MAG: hypothetical protein K2U26_11205 [Cyclobacteriaceae bacterium]|nr:hypothetical protein [Cyclobacteriaceae bacterium]
MFKGLIILFFTLSLASVHAQISVTVRGGVLAGMEGSDSFALNNPWPNGSGKNSIVFLGSGAKGSSFNASVMWEASEIVSVGMIYSTISFSADVGRKLSATSFGPVFKVNFVRNTKRVIPFFLVGYTFSNNVKYSQEKATSTTYAAQVQPAFSGSGTTSLGLIGDFGAEIRLTKSIHALLTAGWRGFDLGSVSVNVPSYGTGFQQPAGFDGTTFLQFDAGLKYYLGKGKKKRDF